MNLPLKWELPGGKVEKEENLRGCLKREIKEELGAEIEILEQLTSNLHPLSENKVIELIPFRCSLKSFEIDLKEHAQIKWLSLSELQKLDWAEADIPIVEKYQSTFKK